MDSGDRAQLIMDRNLENALSASQQKIPITLEERNAGYRQFVYSLMVEGRSKEGAIAEASAHWDNVCPHLRATTYPQV